MPRLTITDVARAAGVSIKTVSRVINREPNVAPAMRARVAAAIEALGFIPNMAARSLAGARSFVIGALFDNPSPSYIVAMQRGAMAACRAAGYQLAIEELDLGGDVAAQMDSLLATARLDGVILSPPVTDSLLVLDALDAKRISYVRLMPATDPGRSHAIVINDDAAAADVARHLWMLGHRRFAILTGPPGHAASHLRRGGFLRGIRAAGGQESKVRIVDGDFTFPSGMAAGRVLLSERDRPTAIFASNDEMAAGLYSAAAQLGLNIPADLSVVGYDDSPIAGLIWPPLTTVRQPIAAMASRAAQLLIEHTGGRAPETIELAYEMIIRQSTGPAPAQA